MRGRVSARANEIAAILLFIALLVLLRLISWVLNPLYPIVSPIQDNLVALGYAWLPFEIVTGLVSFVFLFYQFRESDSLFRRIVDHLAHQFVNVERGLGELQAGQQLTHGKLNGAHGHR